MTIWTSTQDRLDAWGRAWTAFRQRPLFQALGATWFTVALAGALFFLLVVPGLGSGQVREALVNYSPDPRSPWKGFDFSAAIATLAGIAIFSAALRYWSARLLGADPRGQQLQPLTLSGRILLFAIWFAPWLAVAIDFAAVNWQLRPGQILVLTPHWVLAVLCVAMPLGAHWAWHSEGLKSARTRFDASGPAQTFLQVLLPLAFLAAVAVFGSPWRRSVWGLPIDPVVIAQGLGPVAIAAGALTVTTAFGGWMILAGRKARLPIFWIVVLLAVVFAAFDLNDNHPVRGYTVADPPRLLSIGDAYSTWTAQRPDPGGNPPVILVSAEGGGIRAAYFAAITLARIADRCPAAATRIFAVSGVSGGSVGAAAYAAAVAERPINPADKRCDFRATGPGWYELKMNQVFRRDHLSPVLSRMFFPDGLQRFLPFSIEAFDRELGLEHSIQNAFEDAVGHDTLGRPISGFRPTATSAAIPYLFLNATSVEKGDLVFASPVYPLGEDFVYLRSLQDVSWGLDPSLISAAGTSARFTYVSPAGHVKNGAARERFVDGGYFDNSGVVTAEAIYNALRGLPGGLKTTTVLHLHIENQLDCDVGNEDLSGASSCKERPPWRGLSETLSPLRAVLSTRSGRVVQSLHEFDREMTRAQDGGQPHFSLKVQLVDANVPVPLGWLLSRRAAAEMSRQLDPIPNDDCTVVNKVENACTFQELALYFPQSAAP